MKSRYLMIIVVFVGLLSACQPKEVNFAGTWTTNIAVVDLQQAGNKVTGSVKGYGGFWNFDLSGTVSGSTLTFEGETPLGPLAIILAKDGRTFRGADPATAFCGSHDVALPAGCGFSGTWKLKTDLVPTGSLAKLTQTGASVKGAVYDPNGVVLVPLDSQVNWGKGWSAEGVNEWGNFTLIMTANDKAFLLITEVTVPPVKESKEWCGLRETESSAYVLFFTCTIP